MKFTDLINEKCQLAADGKAAIVNLSGMPITTPGRVRTLVSNFSKGYKIKLSVTHDKDADTMSITRKKHKADRPTRSGVEIPVCLFKFVNGQKVTADQMFELLRFKDLFVALLDGSEPTFGESETETENLI